MAQREFFCPACKASLQKSDAMMVLSEIHQGGGSYMAMTSVEEINCPGCGAAMRVEDVVAGKYDHQQGALAGCIGSLVVLGLIGFAITQCSGG